MFLRKCSVVVAMLMIATASAGQDLEKGTVTAWLTRVVRFNPGSGRAQEISYIYRIRGKDVVLEVIANKGDFKLQEAVEFHATEELVRIKNKSGKVKEYTLTAMSLEGCTL